MNIRKERTRLLITDYSPFEKKLLEDMVASLDNVYLYFDTDKKLIGVPPGLEKSIKEQFPDAKWEDHSSEYWDFARIEPVEHSAKPRNQLQVDFINFVLENAKEKKKLAGVLSPGQGKPHPVSEKIPTPTGWTTMGEIKVGDRVFNAHGKPVEVIGVFPQGVKDVYEITFSDGRTARCGEEHLWLVRGTYAGAPYRVKTLKELMSDYKVYHPHNADDGTNRSFWTYKYRIPLLSDPVEYDSQPVPVHPYIVGALIGNGCERNSALAISSEDEYVPYKIAELCGAAKVVRDDSTSMYYFYKSESRRFQTKDFLKDLPELYGKYSHQKVIPDCYMYNSLEVRLQLLQGLMDTDGHIESKPPRFNVSYTSTSRKLLEQIQELIRGLGFIANICPDKRFSKYTNRYCSTVNIRVPQKFKPYLFTHPRKHRIAEEAALRSDYKQPLTHLLIKDIQKVGQEAQQCIMVDDPEHLYLCDQFIVTHNTFMAIYSAINVGLRTLIIVPTTSIRDQWRDTLINMFNVPPERILTVTNPRQFVKVSADFVVVSQASLAALNKRYDLEAIMKDNKFGTKIIDEVQMWFHNIIKVDSCSNIANNWYLTGTFGRSGDTENKLYHEMFGDLNIFREKQKTPTLFNRKPGNIYGMKPHCNIKMYWGTSGLSPEEIHSVTNSMRYSEREGKWIRYGINMPAYMKLVIPSDGHMTKYLDMILKVVQKAEKEAPYGKTLILGSTIDTAEIVAGYVKKLYMKKTVGTIHSRNTKEQNIDVKKNCDIIVSTISSAGTGFDVPGLAKLILFSSVKSWVLTTQILGRNRRRSDGKDTFMYDIVDSSIPQLRAWANVRADIYRQEGKSFKVIDI